jgi:ABC-2 type transport system ATP-binding protein
VLGHDIVREADAVRARLSLTGQFASVDADLTGRENLLLLGLTRTATRARIAVIDHGRLVAEGTPAQLKASVGAPSLDEAFAALTQPASHSTPAQEAP